jgi:hypothetical protein
MKASSSILAATMALIALSPLANAEALPAVSATMVQLLTSPEKYDGKRIRVIGILNLEFEGTALYLRPNDATTIPTNYKNGFWIRIPVGTYKAKKPLHRKPVILEGTFDVSQKGHLSGWPAGITDISHLTLWTGPIPSTLQWKQ